MRLSRKLGGLLAAAMMATGLTAAAMPARAGIPSSEIMTNRGNGTVHECLQDDTGGTVTQHFCDPTFTNAHQLWLPISTGGDGYKFENLATGLCMWAFENGPPHNGVPITLSSCTVNDTNSRWAWGPFLDIPQAIQSRVAGSTGFCLDVPGASSAIGLQMQLFSCNNTNAQIFFVTQSFPA